MINSGGWAANAGLYTTAAREACEHTGLIDPATAGALAYVVWAVGGQGYGNQTKAFMSLGEELSHTEKVVLGVLPQTRLTREAYSVLTDQGRVMGPKRAYQAIFRAVESRRSAMLRDLPLPPAPKPVERDPFAFVDIERTPDLIRAKLTPQLGEAVWFEVGPDHYVRRHAPNRVEARQHGRASFVYTVERGKIVRRRPSPEEKASPHYPMNA